MVKYFTINSKGVCITLCILFLNLIVFLQSYAGIALNTLIKTNVGHQSAADLNTGDIVICTDRDGALYERAILAIKDAHEIPWEVILEDDTLLCVSSDQKFFLPQQNIWLGACTISPGDVLLQQNGNTIKVKCVTQSDEKKVCRFIYVDEYHNFFAGENCVLAHNIVLGAYLAWELACLFKVSAIAGAIALRAYAPRLIEKITGKNIRPALQKAESIATRTYKKHQQSSKKSGLKTHPNEHKMSIEPRNNSPLPEGFQPVTPDHTDFITLVEYESESGILVFDPYQMPTIQPTGFQPLERHHDHGIIGTPINNLDPTIIITRNLTIQDLIAGSKPGKKTHKAHQYIRPPTGFQGANEDFDQLGLSNITYGPRSGMRKGFLPDGRTVSVRAESSEGSPTLEVRGKKNVTAIKFRYPEPGKENEQ